MINKDLLITLLKEATAAGLDVNIMLAECLQDVRDYVEAKEILKECDGEYLSADEVAQGLGL